MKLKVNEKTNSNELRNLINSTFNELMPSFDVYYNPFEQFDFHRRFFSKRLKGIIMESNLQIT